MCWAWERSARDTGTWRGRYLLKMLFRSRQETDGSGLRPQAPSEADSQEASLQRRECFLPLIPSFVWRGRLPGPNFAARRPLQTGAELGATRLPRDALPFWPFVYRALCRRLLEPETRSLMRLRLGTLESSVPPDSLSPWLPGQSRNHPIRPCRGRERRFSAKRRWGFIGFPMGVRTESASFNMFGWWTYQKRLVMLIRA